MPLLEFNKNIFKVFYSLKPSGAAAGAAIQKSEFRFWHRKAAEFTHTLIFSDGATSILTINEPAPSTLLTPKLSLAALWTI